MKTKRNYDDVRSMHTVYFTLTISLQWFQPSFLHFFTSVLLIFRNFRRKIYIEAVEV